MLGGVQSRLVGKRMVNEGGQSQALSVRPERVGKRAHGEAVQDHPGTFGDPLEGASEAGLRARVALGESALEPMGTADAMQEAVLDARQRTSMQLAFEQYRIFSSAVEPTPAE